MEEKNVSEVIAIFAGRPAVHAVDGICGIGDRHGFHAH
jgi:hypothetical protein